MTGIVELCGGGQPSRTEPTTATFLPLRILGLRASTKPFSKAISMICFSISSIATGWLIDTQHTGAFAGAGQILPVNSGKLLVEAQDLICFFPALAVDRIIEFRDHIA